MATNFNYVNEYASLGVNLNRQKYGPLDGSSVFKSMNDLTYYVITSKNSASVLSSDSNVSARFNEIFTATDDYLKNLACYAYVGQTVAIVENGTTKIYKITNVPENVSEVGEVLSNNDFCKQIDDVDDKISQLSTETNVLTSDGVISVISKIGETSGIVSVESTPLIKTMVSGLTADLETLSTLISSKVFIKQTDELTAYDNLSVVKILRADYDNLVEEGVLSTLSNVIFIVENDVLDAYGERIVNVDNGVADSDAINVGQVKSISSEIKSEVNTVFNDVETINYWVDANFSNETQPENTLIVKPRLSVENGSVESLSVKTGNVDYISATKSKVSTLTVLNEVAKTIVSYEETVENLSALNATFSTISADSVSVPKMSSSIELSSGNIFNKIWQDNGVVSASQIVLNQNMVSGLSTDMRNISSELSTLTSAKVELANRINSVSTSVYNDLCSISSDLTSIIDVVSSDLSSEVSEQISAISSAVDSKIWFKSSSNGEPTTGYNDLSIVKIVYDDYEKLVVDGDISALSNVLFEVYSDNVNAYDRQVKNVADATDDNDAVNYSQLKSSVNSLQKDIVNILSGYPNLTSVDFNNLQMTDVGNMLKFIFQKLGGLA